METLDSKIQNKIDNLIDEAYDCSQNGDYTQSFELLQKAWDLYPFPKENWTESYNTAKYIFEDYLKIKEYDKAKNWLEKMTEINNAYRACDENSTYDEDLQFCAGKYYYETGNLEEAYKQWRETVRKSGKNHFRYFENEDKKYLDFYKKQNKLQG